MHTLLCRSICLLATVPRSANDLYPAPLYYPVDPSRHVSDARLFHLSRYSRPCPRGVPVFPPRAPGLVDASRTAHFVPPSAESPIRGVHCSGIIVSEGTDARKKDLVIWLNTQVVYTRPVGPRSFKVQARRAHTKKYASMYAKPVPLRVVAFALSDLFHVRTMRSALLHSDSILRQRPLSFA